MSGVYRFLFGPGFTEPRSTSQLRDLQPAQLVGRPLPRDCHSCPQRRHRHSSTVRRTLLATMGLTLPRGRYS